MIRDPERGISAGICHKCGEEVPFCATFCPVCGQRFVYAQLMPDIQSWLELSEQQRRTVYQEALTGTLNDICAKGDWRIGCVNKASTELSDLITKPTIKNHKIKKSPRLPGDRAPEMERIAQAMISTIEYEKEYDEYEPVFELFQQTHVSSLVEPKRELVEACRTLSNELLAYLRRHPDALYRIDPKVFEQLVAEILSSYGFDVDLNVRLPAGEVDIIALSRDVFGKRIGYLVECKRYAPRRHVSIGQVARLYELKRASEGQLGIPFAMFVTTSDFTRDAKQFYGGRWDLDLKNCDALLEWLRTYGNRNA